MRYSILASACAASLLLPASALLAQQQAATPAILSALHLRRASLQDLKLPATLPNAFALRVGLGNSTYTLNVHHHSLRAAGYQLLVDDGSSVRAVTSPADSTYQGNVVGVPDSRVALTLWNGQVQAFISLGARDWWVQPVTDAIKTAPATQHVVYELDDAIIPKGFCNRQIVPPMRPDTPLPTPTSVLGAAEVALDCDYEYYKLNGTNVGQTQAAATQIMNAVDVIYRRDVEICYTITTILVRTAKVYTQGPQVGCCGATCGLLPEMDTRWTANHANIKRDLAHMFTGWGTFSGTIGCAGPPVCGLTGFGVSRTVGSLAGNTALVAHEMGHQWNAGHCSGNDCFIMCAGLGNCGGSALKFGAASKTAILAYKATRGCLGRCGGCSNEADYTHFGKGCPGSGQGGKANCLQQNWNQSVGNNAYSDENAIVARSGTIALPIESVDLYIWAQSAVQIPISIYARAASGGPGTKLGTAMMSVGTSAASYRAKFPSVIYIAPNTEFYISFTTPPNFTPFVASPIATSGTLADSYFESGGNWYFNSTKEYWNFNVNCFGGGATPSLVAATTPGLNSFLRVSVTGGRANSLAVLLYSLATADIDLTGAGAPGCRLYVGGTFLVEGAVTDGQGTGNFQALPIPNDTTLCGVLFYQQAFVNDPPTNALNYVGTSRGQPRIGN